MKNTPLTQLHVEAGAKIVEFAGYNMPIEYSGIVKEHLAVRNEAGLFDVSHMGEFILEGKDALEILQRITTNDVSKIKVDAAQYNCLPNENGGIIDDLIIYRLNEEKYLLVVNAANLSKDWEWIKHNVSGNASLKDISDETALLALQGPNAVKILNELTDFDTGTIKSFNLLTTKVVGIDNVIISATGYTGAGGFELFCNSSDAENLWKAVMKAGVPYGLKPVGLAARDTLRIEMGYSLYGNDIDDSTSPLEAGLGWIVKTNKSHDFIGKDKMLVLKEAGMQKKMVGITLKERGIPRKGYLIVNSTEQTIGEVTSGTQSPILNKGIGMAYINIEFAKEGTEVFLQVRKKLIPAQVVKFPFI